MALHVTRQHHFYCRACGQPMEAGESPALSKITCLSCKEEQLVPACLADLILQEKLGLVAAGEVFRGIDEPLGRKVDILILNHVTGTASALVDATLRVYRALARLDHPYLQRVHRLLACDGHAIVVTEPRTQSLVTLMGKNKMPPEQLLNLAIQAAHGFEAASNAGMCHMCLRPNCFQLSSHVTIRIMGFSPWNHPFLAPPSRGWASLAPTPFLAPEVRHDHRPNTQSDMYAFGVCLLYFLTHQMPDENLSASDILHREQKNLDPEWVSVLATLLTYDPAGRPPNWGWVIAVLKGRRGSTDLAVTDETLEDLRERSALAHQSLHATDKVPSGFLDGMVSADVEFNPDEVMNHICAISNPDDAVYLTGEQLAHGHPSSPVDIATRAVVDGHFDESETAMLRAAQVGEIDE